MPRSTETIFRSGCLSKMPAKMVLMTTRALPRNNIEPPMAPLTYSCCEGQ